MAIFKGILTTAKKLYEADSKTLKEIDNDIDGKIFKVVNKAVNGMDIKKSSPKGEKKIG